MTSRQRAVWRNRLAKQLPPTAWLGRLLALMLAMFILLGSVAIILQQQWSEVEDAHAALQTIRPNSDGTINGWRIAWTGGSTNLYAEIDDDPNSSTPDAIFGPNKTDDTMYVLLDDLPQGFTSATSVEINAEHGEMQEPVGNINDYVDIYYQIVQSDESTAITAETTATTLQGVTAILTAKTVSITGTNDKSTWDGARLRIRQDYRQVGSGDPTSRADIIAVEVNITSTATPTLTQNDYRWYVNADSTDVTDPWPSGGSDVSLNTPITLSDSPPWPGDEVRLRMNITASTADLGAASKAFKLQYGVKAGAACGGGDESWTDVGGVAGSEVWRGYNNATPADGATLGSTKLAASDTVESYEETNNSVSNPNAIATNNDGEWDWVLTDNGAPDGTSYCFKMVESGGSDLNGGYTTYPELITNGTVTLTQNDYRWYVNANSTDVTDPWPSGGSDVSENAAITAGDTPPVPGDVVRLRVNANVTSLPFSASSGAFKLQYGVKAGAACGGGDESWTDVGGLAGSEVWRGYDNATPADGATLGSTKLAASDTVESYEETNNSVNNPNAVAVGNDGEWDWVLTDNGAPEGTNYCFKMVDSAGSDLNGGYSTYPELVTFSLDLRQRAYIFESDDGTNVNSNSDMAAANTAITSVKKGERIAARIQIENQSAGSASKTYKLQYDHNDSSWIDIDYGASPDTNNDSNFGDFNTVQITNADDVGSGASIAVGNDGYPVIAYYNATGADLDLMVTKCNDYGCVGDDETTTQITHADNVGADTSIAIGDDGYPVIAHYNSTDGDLMVTKCNDSACTGGDETTSQVTHADNIGNMSSLAIGSDGYPVIAHYNSTDGDLMVTKCNDASCAGDNETTTQYIDGDTTGHEPNIAISGDGYPIIAHYNSTDGDLIVTDCNDAACDGTGETISQITGTGSNGGFPSIAIGTNGYPVIVNHNYTNWSLLVTACNDVSCAGDNETTTEYDHPNASDWWGANTDIVIDRDGLPLISDEYYPATGTRKIALLKCANPTCTKQASKKTFNVADDLGEQTALAIGVDGYPVVAYQNVTDGDLTISKQRPVGALRPGLGLSGASGDALTARAAGTCTTTSGANGKWYEGASLSDSFSLNADTCAELAFVLDTSEAVVGQTYRLRLVQSSGAVLNNYYQYPTLSMVSETNNIKHYSKEDVQTTGSSCGTGSTSYECVTVDSAVTLAATPKISMVLGLDANPVMSYYDGGSNNNLVVTKCNDRNCLGGDEATTTVDSSANDVGMYSSIAIGTDGYPVISYYDSTASSLKVAKCNDPACVGGDESITTVEDIANIVGLYSSIAIGFDGLPVIAYKNDSAKSLKVAKCNDAACAGVDETITTVEDIANKIGSDISMAIGHDGNPVISYYNESAKALKVAKCNDPACVGGDETITTVEDPANSVGTFTSIAIGNDSFPVISYFDVTAGSLKVAKCNDSACAGANETITTVYDPGNSVGSHTSIAIGLGGYPVISMYDSTALALYVVKCNDTACAGANETQILVDDHATNNLGGYNALVIGLDGRPIIVYQDSTNAHPKVATELGVALTGPVYFDDASRQLKYHQDSTTDVWPQFVQASPLVEDGLTYWLDDTGYSYVTTDDSNLDTLVASSTETPVYTFTDKHSVNTGELYATWVGQSTVGAGTKNIKLEVYRFGSTNAWETVTTESACLADVDCEIVGNKTTNLPEYYFARPQFDSSKQEKDISAEYWTYWRVFQAEGAETIKTDLWSLSYTPPPSNAAPGVPTDLYSNNTTAQAGQTNPVNLSDTTPAFSAIYVDSDTGDTANKARMQVSTDNTFASVTHWDSGSAGSTISDVIAGNRSGDIVYNALGSAATLSLALNDGDVTYYWRLKFWDDEPAEGSWSSAGSFKLLDIPTAPSGANISGILPTQLTINWTDNSSGQTQEANFELHHSTDGVDYSSVSSPAQDSTTADHTSLSPDTLHYYKVRAVNTAGNSAFSGVVSNYTAAYAPLSPILSAPSAGMLNCILDQNSNPSTVKYAIAVSTDNFVADTQYVQSDDTLGATLGEEDWQTYANWGGISGVDVTGLSASTTYYFKVKARNQDSLETNYSNTVNQTTLNTSNTLEMSVLGTNLGTVDQTGNNDLVEFGFLLPGSPATAIQTVSVGTNATSGYRVDIRADQKMTLTTNPSVDVDFILNGTEGSNTTPVAWATPTGTAVGQDTAWIGYHTSDALLGTGTTTRFSAADKWAGFSTLGNWYEVLYLAGPTSGNDEGEEFTHITFKIQTNNLHPSGNYDSQQVKYRVVPLY